MNRNQIIEKIRKVWGKCSEAKKAVKYLSENVKEDETLEEIVKNHEIKSEWAYRWAMDIGDRKIMRDRVTESEWACRWISDIGDRLFLKKCKNTLGKN